MQEEETTMKNTIVKKCLNNFEHDKLYLVPGLPLKPNLSIVYPQTPKLKPATPPEIKIQ